MQLIEMGISRWDDAEIEQQRVPPSPRGVNAAACVDKAPFLPVD